MNKLLKRGSFTLKREELWPEWYDPIAERTLPPFLWPAGIGFQLIHNGKTYRWGRVVKPPYTEETAVEVVREISDWLDDVVTAHG